MLEGPATAVSQWPAMTGPSVDSASMANSWDDTADWSKTRQMQGRRPGDLAATSVGQRMVPSALVVNLT
jgi:hypothetical protein